MKILQFLGPQEFGVLSEIAKDLTHKQDKLKERYDPVEFPWQPFSKIVETLDNMCKTESIIRKLEYIYKFTTSLGVDGVYIDSDNLKGLMIYLVIQSQNTKLLIDIILWDKFTPETLKMSNRSYYLMVIYSAFEFIEGLTDDKINSLHQNCKERIRKENENGCYLPSKLLQDFLSQKNFLQFSFKNQNWQQWIKIYPEEWKCDNEWLILKDSIGNYSKTVIETDNNSIILENESILQCEVDLNWNFYKSGHQVVQEEDGFNLNDDKSLKLLNRKEASGLRVNGLLNENPFKNSIFQENSWGIFTV